MTPYRFLLSLLLVLPQMTYADECVVFLHGLSRTANAMEDIAAAFEDEGFRVSNVDYPSRKYEIPSLSEIAVGAGIDGCADARTIHFVTHSLGGILVRYYFSNHSLDVLGRVVMLGPPNQGSEIVDVYGGWPGYKLAVGPAGTQLGTEPESVPMSLGPVEFELGIIAGNKTFSPILSAALPDPDDGKVSVERTKVAGMNDFIVVPVSHPFIMQSDVVIRQAIQFIRTGQFDHDVSS